MSRRVPFRVWWLLWGVPGLVESLGAFSGHRDRCLHFELYRRQHAEQGVPSLPEVPDLGVVEHRVGQLIPARPALAVKQFDLPGDQKDSIMELS